MSVEDAPRIEHKQETGDLQIAASFYRKTLEMPHTPAKIVAQLLAIDLRINKTPEEIQGIWAKNRKLVLDSYANEEHAKHFDVEK